MDRPDRCARGAFDGPQRGNPIVLIEPISVLCTIVVGVGATLIVDLWALVLKRAFHIPSLSYCLVGRWLRHMPGTIRHASIAAATPKHSECLVGWIAHYMIGIVFALAFVAIAPAGWLARPTFSIALAFGIGTVLFPFLVLQPALGLGIAASKTADPARARLKSLATHAVFGAALYLCAVGLNQLLQCVFRR